MRSISRREAIALSGKCVLTLAIAKTLSLPSAFAASGSEVNVVDFGALGDGRTDDSVAFQKAIDSSSNIGHLKVYVPKPKIEYRLESPIYLTNNVELYGEGKASKIVFINPSITHGRGGFVIGSSVEANKDLGLQRQSNKNIKSTINNEFKNPHQGQYLRDNPNFVQAKNVVIHNVLIEAIFDSDTETNWGGYGINFVNALNCHAYNIWGNGWTQLIGMGSDVPPETPSNHKCTARNLYVITPDLVRTYYSIGFIANSTNCSIENAVQYIPMTDDSKNGSGVALNYCEDCIVSNINIPNLGRTQTSEGVLINNSSGCIVQNIFIGNAKKAASSFYIKKETLDKNKPNIFKNIKGRGCDAVLTIYSKYNIIKNVSGINCKKIIALMNSNATNNEIYTDPDNISSPKNHPIDELIKKNTIHTNN